MNESPSSLPPDGKLLMPLSPALGRVVAVITLEAEEQAAPIARALLEGGVHTVELTLRTPVALAALRAMRAAAPNLLLGAGTVLTPRQADEARDAGADFVLAPGLDTACVRHCAKIGMPVVPGIATASDIQAALTLGCRLLKFFPAEPLGGVRGLRTLAAPFAHLNVRYLPLGGIDAAKAPAYFAERCVAALGGSWIAPANLIRQREWDAIRARAEEASALAATSPAEVER